MRKLLICLLLLSGCGTTTSTIKLLNEEEADTVRTEASCSDPVLRVSYLHKDGMTSDRGTGTLVKHRGQLIVLSAYHVFSDPNGETIELYTVDNWKIKFTLVKTKIFADCDIIAIYVKDMTVNVKPMAVGSAKLDSTVTAVGYPDNREQVHNSGKVINIEIEASARVRSGMSGGPLVVNKRIVGVTTKTLLSSRRGNGGVHVPIEKILELLR